MDTLDEKITSLFHHGVLRPCSSKAKEFGDFSRLRVDFDCHFVSP